ncbi:MAG TPA: ABC transporter ATP-binding protein, partial [Nocardiopsis listeri]|nr:ABC transporter ATP-binding protein [Nocardiopsis listeri]
RAGDVTVPLGASETVAADKPAEDEAPIVSAAERRAAQKEMQRVERRMDKIAKQEARLHEQMAEAAEDYTRLAELDAEAKALAAEKDELEMVWLEQAELVGD